MAYSVFRFPMSSHFFLTANEKDFSLALEMTVWGSESCPEGAEVGFPSTAEGTFFRLPFAFPFANETP